MALLSIENLSFTYPLADNQTLKNINLSVEKGDFVVVTGSMASGKSTLLRLLKRELQPQGEQTGTILYQGRVIDEVAADVSAREVGFVQQDPNSQWVTAKVWTELAFGLENLNVPTAEIRSRVAEMAHYFGISHWFEKELDTLSAGQKQLVNLAAIVIMRPKVLLLDEPTAQLDPIAASAFMETLIKLNRELQLTVIVVEHHLEELVSAATRLVVLTEGQLSLNQVPAALRVSQLKESLPFLPVTMQVHAALAHSGAVPLSLKAGSEFLSARFTGASRLETEANSEPGQKTLKLRKVTFSYERFGAPVLNKLTLQLNAGEIFTLVGSNGTGKSTLLKVIAGSLKAQGGKIATYQQRVIYLPQDVQGMFLGETLREDLRLYGQYLALAAPAFSKRFAEMMDFVEVASFLDTPFTDLSGGQLQLSALAKILFADADVLLLDEPTKGLDQLEKERLKGVLENLSAAGKTILIVTHDLDFAATVASRCGLFFQGEVLTTTEPRLFFQQHYFYTTTTHRLGRHLYPEAIVPSELIRLCLAEEEGQPSKEYSRPGTSFT